MLAQPLEEHFHIETLTPEKIQHIRFMCEQAFEAINKEWDDYNKLPAAQKAQTAKPPQYHDFRNIPDKYKH